MNWENTEGSLNHGWTRINADKKENLEVKRTCVGLSENIGDMSLSHLSTNSRQTDGLGLIRIIKRDVEVKKNLVGLSGEIWDLSLSHYSVNSLGEPPFESLRTGGLMRIMK
jgi:hypothetical protein